MIRQLGRQIKFLAGDVYREIWVIMIHCLKVGDFVLKSSTMHTLLTLMKINSIPYVPEVSKFSQFFIYFIYDSAWHQKIAILIWMQFLNDVIKSRHGFNVI